MKMKILPLLVLFDNDTKSRFWSNEPENTELLLTFILLSRTISQYHHRGLAR